MNREIKRALRRYERAERIAKRKDDPLFDAIKYFGSGIFVGLILAGIIFYFTY